MVLEVTRRWFIGSYTTPPLISDDELNFKNEVFQLWATQVIWHFSRLGETLCLKKKLFSPLAVVEPLHIFLTRDVGCGKSVLMKVMYQSLTKIFSYGNVSVDKEKFLQMVTTCAALVNIDGNTIHTALNVPVCHKLPSLYDEMRNTSGNRLSDLKVYRWNFNCIK